MSPKRVKREAINLVTPERPDRPDVECDRLRKEVCHKNEVCPSHAGLRSGYHNARGLCEQDAKEFELWSVY